MRKKNVIYIRQSLNTNKQKHSLDMQKSICLEYAKNNDLIIHEIYDEGVMSARKTSIQERPVLNRLLNDVKEGTIGQLIVFKRDRLARNVHQYIQVVRILQQENVKVHFTADNEPPMFTGVASEFIEVILAGIAQHEADNIVRRLIQAKKQVMRDGKWAAGKPPYAYEIGVEPGVLEIDEDKKENVKKIYEKFLEYAKDINDFSLIAKEIRKIPELSKLTNEQIWKIIAQPLHKGLMLQKLDNEEIPKEKINLKIIDQVEDWEEANRILKTLIPPGNIKLDGDESSEEQEEIIIPLLRTVIYCDNCNTEVKTILKVYKCPKCNSSIKIIKADQEVIEKVLQHLKKKGNAEWEKVISFLRSRYTKPFHKMISDYEANIRKLEEEIKENFKKHIETSSGDRQLKSLIKDYQEQSKLLEKIKSTNFHIQQYLIHLNKEVINELNVESLTFLQKQHLVKLVSRVNIKNKMIKKIAVHAVKGC